MVYHREGRAAPDDKTLLRCSLSLVALVAAAGGAMAQSAGPGATVQLDEIVVQGSTANAAVDDTRKRLGAIAGGTAAVGSEDNAARANVSITDSLDKVPGVVASPFLGGNDQPKVVIRGSGLQTNPVERGLMVLQDGLPINRADGSAIIGLIDARQAEVIEVFRGYTANRLGMPTLGGAVNFVSPTGSRTPGVEVSLEGGSNGHLLTALKAGARQGNFDAMGQLTWTQRDGFRDWNESERINAAVNVGAKISDNVTTRMFFGYTKLGFEVSGPLSWQRMQNDPTQAAPGPIMIGGVATEPGPNVLRDKPRRDTEQFRVGSRTTANFGPHLFDAAVGYAHTDDSFRFTIGTGFRDTVGGDATLSLRYAYKPDASALLPLFEATVLYINGNADRTYAINNQGVRGATYGANELSAQTFTAWTGLNLPIAPSVTLSPSISYVSAQRDNSDVFGATRRPRLVYNPITKLWSTPTSAAIDTSFSRHYEAYSPALAVSWQFAPSQRLFASVSRSFEAPTFDDLIETDGTVNATPTTFLTPNLKAQTATTVEGGWRGSVDRLGWDLVAYYSWVDNELIRTTDGSRASTVNADETTHFGIEAGVSAKLTDRLTARVAYTYQDFRFDSDRLYGNNRVAGAPRHVVIGSLRYAITDPWWVEGEVRWVPDHVPVDNANTLSADPFAVFNVRTQYKVNEHVKVFGEVRNVFDANYAGATLVLGRVSRADQAVYFPGDGRGYFGGVTVRF